jgi:hypothetical protein
MGLFGCTKPSEIQLLSFGLLVTAELAEQNTTSRLESSRKIVTTGYWKSKAMERIIMHSPMQGG